MSNKQRQQPYRGLKKRYDRKKDHINKADFERLMFELKRDKRMAIWTKDVKNNHTPTDYFVVEFHLKDKLTLQDFEEMIYHEMGLLL